MKIFGASKMKQVLIYLVEFLKEQYGMSMSEMSKGLGKSRNFIREAITRGYDNEDKYVDIINNLKFNFFYSNDDNEFHMFIEKKHQESIDSYKVALKQSLENNLDEIEEKNKTISDLEHRIVVLSRNVDKGWERTESQNGEIVKLNNTIATKDLFIDGQDKEIQDYKKSMEALAKAGHSTGASLRKAETKNRILTGALIGVGLLWAVSVWLMS